MSFNLNSIDRGQSAKAHIYCYSMQIFNYIPSLCILRNSVFVYPTETCYGLGADAERSDLAERIYHIKGRDFKKPLSFIVADMDMASRMVNFSKTAQDLAERYWPGPVTLVLPARQAFNSFIALRISSHPIAQQISRTLNKPIIATSANISKGKECYSIDDVIEQFLNRDIQPDFIIDGGNLKICPPSTVIKVIGENLEILREGEIKL